MNSLLISDLHLTSNPRDEYRWALFPWLAEQIRELQVKYLFILGDVTEAKDYHSARLVNRVVDNLIELYRSSGLYETYILRGNHDGIDPRNAYFRFLGKYPSIKFVEHPFTRPLDGREVLMLPHSREPAKDWDRVEMHNVDLILMHATVTGAVGENGTTLTGVPAGLLATARRAKIYSGDVHVPQKVGQVEYVGAPYPIRFGDKFTPRAVLLNSKGVARDVAIPAPPAIKRSTLTAGAAGVTTQALAAEKLGKGDQVKVRVRLSPAEFGDWPQARRNTLKACADIGVELCGLELEKIMPAQATKFRVNEAHPAVVTKHPSEILAAWCKENKTHKHLSDLGQRLLKESLEG